MQPLPAHTVRFGPFELDLRAAELCHNGSKTKLPEQPFQVLAALLEHPGDVVTREELRQRLWGSDTFVDFEQGLNTAVKRLRELLSDSAEKPQYIETVPRHGYRLMVPVERLDSAAPAIADASARRRKIWLLVSALLLVAVALGVIWRQRVLEHFRPVKIESLAVLPLENLSGNPEQDYFADGMTEALITELGKVHALRVISRQSVMQYKGTNKTVPQIARELHVDAVVEGSAMRVGDKVRITTQLVQANPERHLWSESYERDLRDVISLQREVSQAIVGEISGKVEGADRTSFASARPVNPEAYESYLRGRYHRLRWPEGLEKSVEYFQKAIEKDPGYAPAYAGLALSYVSLAYFKPPKEAFPKARAAALKALELDERLSEAHTALGYVKLNSDWDWAGAEREFRRALELDPNSTDAHVRYATYLVVMGRFDQGIGEAKRALALDPLSRYTNVALGWEYLVARRHDEAIDQFKKTLELDPNYRYARAMLALSYTLKRKYPEAFAEYKKLEGYSSEVNVGFLYAAMGKRDEALKVIENVKTLSTHAYVDPYDMAAPYAGLADKDQAMKWLNKAYEERSAQMTHLKVEAVFDNLRSDPRFQDLLRRMNFPEQ
jgi:TolB-like protein/DNA-binding winged helix-turn-helix (wHTH) protein/tetratricopeptide (TPR) repeat protein